ncbi:MAG: diguanylate cyclase (GGDEF)-like protein/PAS domain S-box-containing protein [Flavobacteriales bacterium]
MDREKTPKTLLKTAHAHIKQNRIAELYQDSLEAVFIISANSSVLHGNTAGLRLLQADTLDQATDLNLTQFLSNDDKLALSDMSKRIFEGESDIFECELKDLNNTSRRIAIQVSPLCTASGEVYAVLGITRDISQKSTDGSSINDSEHRFKMLSEAIPQQVWTAAPNGALRYVNRRVIDYFGVSEYVILKSGWKDLIHPEDLEQTLLSWTDSLKHCGHYKTRFRLKNASGEYRWHISQALPVLDNTGQVIEWFGTNTDVTELKEADLKLLRARKLLDESQQIAKVGGWELDTVSGELFWTAETYHLHDTSPEEFNPTVDAGVSYFLPESRETITAALQAAIADGKDYDLELETYTTKGRKIDIRTTCRVTQENGKTTKLTGIFQDISGQKDAHRELEDANRSLAHANAVLEHIAHYDPLTRLPNRTLLADRMQQAMVQNQRRGQSIAVAFLDLDGFKEINDTYGHSDGDDLLIHIADRIKRALRDSDTLARIGGDEFVAVLTELDQPRDCEPLIERMLKAAASPITLKGKTVQVSASIGVTIYPQDGVDAEQLLRHSDQAMYLAKQAGKNCFHLFDVAKDVAVKNQREELENIRSALEKEQFVLFYQPKVNMQTGKVVGAEALIRWQHPDKGILPPAAFLPVIEEHPLSISVGEWVIATALKQMQLWRDIGQNIPISVNINALQLQQPEFVQRLQSILEQYPETATGSLELEILETSALSDIAQVSMVINECRALGVNFSLDDFGTGYSSLTYLKRLPAKVLKIDQSFVRDMLDDLDDLAIIQGIIGLASAFGLDIIAEGVETIAHGEALLSLGCIHAQGYGIARPMPAGDIPDWVRTWKPDPAWQRASNKSTD